MPWVNFMGSEESLLRWRRESNRELTPVRYLRLYVG